MKTLFFHILNTFRFFIVKGAKIISFILALCVVVSLFSDRGPSAFVVIVWAVFAIAFAAFAWFYDSMLRRLEPRKSQNQDWS